MAGWRAGLPRTLEEVFMRVLAVVAVLVLGLSARQYFSLTEVAGVEKQAAPNNGLDVLQMQRDLKVLPAQNQQDLTFVFDPGVSYADGGNCSNC
jgi:hypothetical protein